MRRSTTNRMYSHPIVASQLPAQPDDMVQCEYLWIDGSLRNFRTKSKTWPTEPLRAEDLPWMEFCGSATDFDVGNLADYYSRPVRLFKDPFRRGRNRLVLCETYDNKGNPTFANHRHQLLPYVGCGKLKLSFEQPYSLLRRDGKPLSYMDPAYEPHSKAGFSCGREVAEAHYRACLYAGLSFESMECIGSAPGQWKYSIGPSSCVDLSDHVWMSRFILLRVAEDFGVDVKFETPLKAPRLCLHADEISDLQRMEISNSLKRSLDVKSEVWIRHKKIMIGNLDAEVDPYYETRKVCEVLGCS